MHECGSGDVGKNEYNMQGSATQQEMYNAKCVESTRIDEMLCHPLVVTTTNGVQSVENGMLPD